MAEKEKVRDTTPDQLNKLGNTEHEDKINNSRKEANPLDSWDDYNIRGVEDMLQRLLDHKWTIREDKSTKEVIEFRKPGCTSNLTTGRYTYSNNMFVCFGEKHGFDVSKYYTPAGVYSVLEHDGDSRKGMDALYELGFGNKEVEQPGGPTICTFWDVTYDSKGHKKLIFNTPKLRRFLKEEKNISLYFPFDDEEFEPELVRKTDNYIIRKTTTPIIQQLLIEYIYSLPERFDEGTTPEDIDTLLSNNTATKLNDKQLNYITRFEPNFLEHEKGTAYYPFINGVIKVTKEGREIKSYSELDRYVWKKQVIEFNISEVGYLPDEKVEYYKFLAAAICNKKDLIELENADLKKLQYAKCLIGYLLHTYKDPAKPFAVVLAEEMDKDDDGGGTGKGIFVKAIEKLLSVVMFDGKKYNTKGTFSNQKVTPETKIIVIQDAVKGFKMEDHQVEITDGIQIEKKNKQAYDLSYSKSPKFIVTTNFTVPLTTVAIQRRVKVLEFASFFSKNYTPADFFKHNLFDDWDNEEWNRFYLFMFKCVQKYLEIGIPDFETTDSLKYKEIKLSYKEEFLTWFKMNYLELNEVDKNKSDLLKNAILKKRWETEHVLNEWHSNFLDHAWPISEDKKFRKERDSYTLKYFRKALEKSADMFGYSYISGKQTTDKRLATVSFKAKTTPGGTETE